MRTRPYPSRRNRLVVNMPANEGLDIGCTRLLCTPAGDEPPAFCSDSQPVWDGINCVRFGFVAGGDPVGICLNCDPSYGTPVGDLPDGFGIGGDTFEVVNRSSNEVTMTAMFNAELAGGSIGNYDGGSATLYDAQCDAIGNSDITIMQGDGDSLALYFDGPQLVDGQTYYIEFCPTEPGE